MSETNCIAVGTASTSDLWLQRARALWQKVLRVSRPTPKRLHLSESLPLGERRFVAVIEFERWRFLVGGTSASLVLLARLDHAEETAPIRIAGDATSVAQKGGQ